MLDMIPELSVALEAVRLAGTIVMRYYGKPTAVTIKEDRTPVTQADIEAETAIIETIRSRFPSHSIVGEEMSQTTSKDEFAWIIDPIDGTKNFIRGIPFFGIEVALTRFGEPIIGVSLLPALGELLYAQTGCGAFLNGQQVPVHVSDARRITDAHISLGGLNHFLAAEQGANVLRVAGSAGRVRAFGDAYAYHLLATGRCDAVLETGIKFWDVAALTVIIREAGGKCTDLSGDPIKGETRSAMFSNGYLHDDLLALYWANVRGEGARNGL